MNESDDVERQLRAIADHAVGLSRPATVAGDVIPIQRARRRPLVAIGAIATAAAVVAAVAVVANRDDGGTEIAAGASTTQPASGPIEYGGNIAVLESPEHGPQLCTAVAESYPPQCGGPDVVGWDWNAVDGEESADGTTWGSFYVAGTWIDGVFTLTRPATGPVPTPNRTDIDFTTPCEDLRTDDSDAVVTVDGPLAEESSPDFAGAWWDAQHGVYNVAFTGDVEAHQEALRQEYDGRLCVVQREHSEAALLTAQARSASLSSKPTGVEIVGVGIDVVNNALSVDVLVLDAATQERVAGVFYDVDYIVHAALVPIETTSSTDPVVSSTSTTPPRYPNHTIDSVAGAIDTWTASGIRNYSFRIEFQCFCALMSTTVVVIDGVPDRTPGRSGDEYATIPALIAQIERAEREATGEVDVTWGPYGVPEAVEIDWLEYAVDDEIGWTITEFTVGPVA